MNALKVIGIVVAIVTLHLGETYSQTKKSEAEDLPVQYRRGIELQSGYQSYDEKYAGENLEEIKRRLFPLEGAGVWTELNPKVPRVTYFGVHFVNKDTGWAVGDLGALIKTTNGGENWKTISTILTTPLLKVRSYNGQTVIVSGYDGIILRSTDNGETFVQIPTGLGSVDDLWGLEMINDTLGWACGANKLIKTTDDGANWQLITIPGYTGNFWWIEFMNENYGFIAADGRVLRTTDGGDNWNIIQAGDIAPLYSIDVIDSLHIAAAGYGGTNYSAKNLYSSDGGLTWNQGGQLTTEAVNCVQYVNQDTGYLVMTNVSARKTTNRGQDWTTIGGISDNYELQFITQHNIGYSVGSGLRIYKTENSFENWQRLIINDNFSDVYFVSEKEGYAIGSLLYKTTNYGMDWKRVESIGGGVTIYFLDSLNGLLGDNAIYKTTNGGNNWYQTNSQGLGARKFFFINEQVGWAVIGRSILKTTDGGENWVVQFIHINDSFTSIFFVDSLNGWATSRYVHQTTDGGVNWIQRTDVPIYFSYDIYFIGQNGFIINDNQKLYKSSNNGIDWIVQLNSPYYIKNFGWLSDKHGLIMGGSVVYETKDSGSAWNLVNELINVGLQKFHAPSEWVGYSVGGLGLIIKYFDSSYVPVDLIQFTGKYLADKVLLNWSTGSEENNYGFKIFKSIDMYDWKEIGFVGGEGTSTKNQNYTFIDKQISNEFQYYKLKQIDFDGSNKFSAIVSVRIPINNFEVTQNYPNPANPTTTISYTLPQKTTVRVELFSINGERIVELLNEEKERGIYRIEIDLKNYSSGLYFYRITTNSGYTATKKLILIK